MQIAIGSGPIKNTPDPAIVNAQTARHPYGKDAPQYTIETLKTLEGVAFQIHNELARLIKEARRQSATGASGKARSEHEKK